MSQVPPIDWEMFLEKIKLDVIEEPNKPSKFNATHTERNLRLEIHVREMASFLQSGHHQLTVKIEIADSCANDSGCNNTNSFRDAPRSSGSASERSPMQYEPETRVVPLKAVHSLGCCGSLIFSCL